jgi:hypothetical protein
MASNARDRARSLELIIRAAAAEERQLGRRLEDIAQAHQKARGGVVVIRSESPQPQDGNSDR